MIRRLEARITHMQLNGVGLDQNYGSLVFETMANFRMETEHNFDTKYLICFQSMILICEPQFEKESKGFMASTLKSKNLNLRGGAFKLRFIKAITVSHSMVVVETPCQNKVNFLEIQILHKYAEGTFIDRV